MRRIGLLTMALVLALGSLGVAYAAWTDEITIEGTVNTGSVELNVVDYSGSAIYKDLETDEMVSWHGWMGDDPYADDANYWPVASASARAGEGDEADIVVSFENAFPCETLMADFLLHYNGSVPAKLYAEVTDVTGDQALIDNLDVQFMAWHVLPGYVHGEDDIHDFLGDPVDVGVQVHECDRILVAMTIHLPQDNDLMNLEGSFEAMIQAIQWNEYQEGAGFYPYNG